MPFIYHLSTITYLIYHLSSIICHLPSIISLLFLFSNSVPSFSVSCMQQGPLGGTVLLRSSKTRRRRWNRIFRSRDRRKRRFTIRFRDRFENIRWSVGITRTVLETRETWDVTSYVVLNFDTCQRWHMVGMTWHDMEWNRKYWHVSVVIWIGLYRSIEPR